MNLILMLVGHSYFLVEVGIICGKIKQKVEPSPCRPRQTPRFAGGRISQISWQSAHEGRKVVSRMHWPPLPP